MRTRYDEFGIEIKEPSKLPVILFIIVVCIVVALLIFLSIKMTNSTKEQKTETKDSIKTTENPKTDENSSYNEEASLVVPKISNPVIYKIDKLTLNMFDLKADESGYMLYINALNIDTTKTYVVSCDKIAIDKYETTASFHITLSPYANETMTIKIPIEELNNVEINDFNKLTFFLNITENGKTQTLTRDVRMTQRVEIDNNKKGLLKIDEKNKVLLSYYKKIEDEENTYLYFEVENNSKTNHIVKLKKLILNNTLHQVENIRVQTHFETKTIFYIKIPKKEIKDINKMRVSFFIIDSSSDKKATYITVEKELSI